MARRGAPLGRSVLDLDIDDSRFLTKLGAARAAAARWTDQTGVSLMRAGKAISGVGESWSRNITLPIVGAGVAAGKLAFDFDKTMSQVVALTHVGQDEIGAFRDEILKLSPAVGRGPQELGEAFYFVASAGFEGAEAMEILRHTAKAAAAGLGDTATVAKVIGSAVNAYGLEAKDAAGLTDQLVAAIGEGSAEAPEFAGALGNVIGSAAQIGAKFSDVTGAIAAMTNVGIGAEEAVTSLNQVFVTLFKPTKEAADALADYGLTASGLRDQIRNEGLMPTLGMLAEKFDGNAEATAAVFGNVRALRGILALTGPQLDDTSALLDRVADSAGATSKAFDEVAQSDSFKMEQAMARLQVVAVELGADVLPLVVDVLTELAKGAQSLAEWWASLDDGTRDLIVRILAFTAAAGPALIIIGKLTTGLGLLFKTVGYLSKPGGIPKLTTTLGRAGLLGALLAVGLALDMGGKAFRDWSLELFKGKKAADAIRSLRDQLEALGDPAATVAAAKLEDLGVTTEELARIIELAGGDAKAAFEAIAGADYDLARAIGELHAAQGDLVDDTQYVDWTRMQQRALHGFADDATETAEELPPELAAILGEGADEVAGGAQEMVDPIAAALEAEKQEAADAMAAVLQGIVDEMYDSRPDFRDAADALREAIRHPYSDLKRELDVETGLAMKAIRGAFKSGDTQLQGQVVQQVEDWLKQYEKLKPGALEAGKKINPALQDGIDSNLEAALKWIQDNVTGKIEDKFDLADTLERMGYDGLAAYVRGQAQAQRDKLDKRLADVRAELRGTFERSYYQEGLNAGNTFAAGIDDSAANVQDAVDRVAEKLQEGLGIYSEPKGAWSPLRGITKWGGNAVDTIAEGMLGNIGAMQDAVERVGSVIRFPAEGPDPWSPAAAALTQHPYAGASALGGVGRHEGRQGVRDVHIHLEERLRPVETADDIARHARRAGELGLFDIEGPVQ